jgi:hypothetical protein
MGVKPRTLEFPSSALARCATSSPSECSSSSKTKAAKTMIEYPPETQVIGMISTAFLLMNEIELSFSSRFAVHKEGQFSIFESLHSVQMAYT